MTKILFFTAAAKPTAGELAVINTMVAYPGITLAVRNAAAPMAAYDTLETADYAMDFDDHSLIPAAYTVELYPRASKTAPPAPALLSTQKIITSGVEFLSSDKSGVYVNGFTPTIVAGVVSTMLAS